jgi:hypothetical protein
MNQKGFVEKYGRGKTKNWIKSKHGRSLSTIDTLKGRETVIPVIHDWIPSVTTNILALSSRCGGVADP